MVTKRQVDKLTENLSAREAALIAIQCLEDMESGRDPAYSKEELAGMRESLEHPLVLRNYTLADHKYRQWLNLYLWLRHLAKEAEVASFRAQATLNSLSEMVHLKMIDRSISVHKTQTPVLMTEREFRDKKKLQREWEFKELHCLKEVIGTRALRLAEEEGIDVYADDGYMPEFIAEAHPEYFEKAESEIRGLIESGRLKPVKHELKAYYKRAQETDNISWLPKNDNLKPGSERAVWLYQHYLSGEELYGAGLPEWTEVVDEFKPAYHDFQADEWHNIHGEIAIVRDPHPSHLDERGWYEKGEFFKDILGIHKAEAGLLRVCREEGLSPQEMYDRVLGRAEAEIGAYKAAREIIGAVSGIMQVDMSGKLREADRGLLDAVEAYNGRVGSMGCWYVMKPSSKELEEVNLYPIDMEGIPVREHWLEAHREIVSHFLGNKWWEKDPEGVDIYVPGEREARSRTGL